MKFKVGQRVELVDNSGMSAPKGSIGIIRWINYTHDTEGIVIEWVGDAKYQMRGNYLGSRFRILPQKNEQLEFAFME